MTSEALSLVEYVRKQRQKDCPVCQISLELRTQMKTATEKSIKRSVVLAWLKEVYGLDLTDRDMTTHYSGKHDDA